VNLLPASSSPSSSSPSLSMCESEMNTVIWPLVVVEARI
jgi:hypothetical protein